MRDDQVDDLLDQVETLEDRLEKTEQALEAKDRELAEARAEIERSEIGRHRLGHALRGAESKAADADWWKSRALRSERERDEAMAALREKEERVKALEALVGCAVSIFENCSVESGMCCCGDAIENHPEPMDCGHSPTDHGGYVSIKWVNSARSVLSSVQPVSGSRQQRGNEEG